MRKQFAIQATTALKSIAKPVGMCTLGIGALVLKQEATLVELIMRPKK